MKEKTFLLGTLILIISISAVSGNNGDFYNFSFNSEDAIVHLDIKDTDVVYFTQNGNVYRADMNSNKPVLLDSLGSRVSQITSSGNMISIRTEDKKLYVFNHDERVIYKFQAYEGELQRVIIDDRGYLAVITIKDIALGTREWLGYVYSPSGDLIAQNRSSSVLTSFISLNDKIVFGEGSGNVSVYDSTGSTKLWVNNIGTRIMGFQHYGDDVLLASEKSIYSLSYVDSPKLSKILSIDDYPSLLVSDNERVAISSIEGCLYVLSSNSLQNQFSFDGSNVIKSCQQNDDINDVYLLEDKTVVLTETGKIFVIQGGDNKLTINTQNTTNSKVSGYINNGRLYIVSQSDYKLDVYNYDNILDLEKEINDAKTDYASFLNKIKEEKVPTFEGEAMLNDIERNYSGALSYWDAGNYKASKEYLDEYNSGVKEYLGQKETKSTNLFSMILIAAVLILAVVAILFSRRKKSVECPKCGYILRDYWSHCPRCGERKGGR
jgi:hypothetical protein